MQYVVRQRAVRYVKINRWIWLGTASAQTALHLAVGHTQLDASALSTLFFEQTLERRGSVGFRIPLIA